LAHLEKIPFPPDNGRMPGFPSEIRGSWLENAFNDYSKGYWYSDVLKRNVTEPGRILDKVVDFSIERNVPVYCGEFGVYQYNALHEDRVRWYEIVSGALDRRNISRTCWEYYGGFGIFNGDMSDFNSDLNVDIVRAMGFTYPMQISRSTNAPDSSITFFDDYPNNMFTASAWGENTDFTLFETNTAQGRYAIRWGNADRYSGFSFVFDNAYDRSIDFSRFASQNYYLEFKARVERPVSFDVRFVNNESSSSIPWRISYKIDESTLLPNGRWQTVRIPLRGMWEGGASVFSNGQGQWLSPRWEFSWVNVKSLEFTAEYTGLNGITIWFDDIKIAR
jgi:endoglucanase